VPGPEEGPASRQYAPGDDRHREEEDRGQVRVLPRPGQGEPRQGARPQELLQERGPERPAHQARPVPEEALEQILPRQEARAPGGAVARPRAPAADDLAGRLPEVERQGSGGGGDDTGAAGADLAAGDHPAYLQRQEGGGHADGRGGAARVRATSVLRFPRVQARGLLPEARTGSRRQAAGQGRRRGCGGAGAAAVDLAEDRELEVRSRPGGAGV
jgi:hypothetical protein